MANRARKWEAAFLEALEVTGTISGAAKEVEIGRQTVYDYLNADPGFSARCRDAIEGADDELQAEGRRRAIEGEQVPVFYRGKLVGHKPRKSDTLLMFLLRIHDQRRQGILQRARAQRFNSLALARQQYPSHDIKVTCDDDVIRTLEERCELEDLSPEEGPAQRSDTAR